MKNGKVDHRQDTATPLWLDLLPSLPVLIAVCVFYFWTATSSGNIRDLTSYYYPLMARSFVEGHLYIDITPAPELLALPDPYDPTQNQPWRVHDASLYNGKYYLYYGPTPAVILFAPWLVLTYDDFPENVAVALFCSFGFICASLLLLLLIRDYFPRLPLWLKLVSVLTLGMANSCPYLLRRPDVYETTISCAFFMLQLAFLSLYCALRRPQQALWWLLLSSAALGAAVGARPNDVFVVLIFIGLLVWLWRLRVVAEEARAWLVFAALAPVSLIGLLLAWYNYARFGSPFEFGTTYQLAGDYVRKVPPTHVADLPYSLGYYFFWPPHYGSHFPFIHALPYERITRPDKMYALEPITGLFVGAPIGVLALAWPLLLRKFRRAKNQPLILFAGFIFLASLAVFLPIFLAIPCPTMRYLVDFGPGLILLGCLMGCYFHHSLKAKSKRLRWLYAVGLFTVLMAGCVTGFFLSFTGYYDYLKIGSPDTYAALQSFFHPLEVVLQAGAGLFDQ
jgi:4-amino-4-deoxy-L-arabinose transferase-like glycosyltransferase